MYLCGLSHRLLEAFAYNSTTRTPHSFFANGVKFGSDRTIMKDTTLLEKVISQLYLDFQWRDLPQNFIIRYLLKSPINDVTLFLIGR